MKCPVDGATLVMTERSGVEIDYCPQCRGVWLDRGELDKILERSGRDDFTRRDDRDDRPRRDDRDRTPPRYDDRDSRGHGYGKPKKKKEWLSEIFDFD